MENTFPANIVIFSFFGKKWKKNPVYGQILLVCLAFAAMVASSYFFVGRIMRSQLASESKATLDHMQDNIESDLQEPEMLIRGASQFIRRLILQGYHYDTVHEYLHHISEYIIKNEKYKLRPSGIYGYFDAFDGLFLHGEEWQPPPGYEPVERPWYTDAVEGCGQIVFTKPYTDMRTSDLVISYSTRIFLDDRPLGVISMNVSLSAIAQYVEETKIAEDGYGILLNEKFEIIAHPSEQHHGKPLSNLNSGGGIVRDLEHGKDVFGRIIKNSTGIKVIVFIRHLRNDWYVGILTPKSNYFNEVTNMGLFLITLSMLLTVLLSVILWHIAALKNKSDTENRQKSEFLATMSHEIRTPMNAILGITEIQLRDEALREDIKEALSKIYNSGDLLLGIINDILDFSKIEAGKLELIPVQYSVPSLINDVVQLNKIRYEDEPIEFTLQVQESVPSMLTGDELRIKQILNNLLSNAFKYTQKGDVSLSVGVEYMAQGDASPVTLVFRVSDTGQGMTADQVRKLGDKYTRFNLEANRTTQGTGLGMNITQRLTRMMGGSISVKSTPGKGTQVTVRLPQQETGTTSSGVIGKELAEALQQFRMSSTLQKEKSGLTCDPMPYGKVLIVDDVDTNLYVARGLMSPYGLSVDTAVSGYEAIDRIKDGKVYDIIFMDHMMPKMDGIEATKKIRDLGYTYPVIALTANALAGQAEMFLVNGFDGFISKPIDVRQLNNWLNKLIRDKQPPEVIEAARRQKDKENACKKKGLPSESQLPDFFAQDAKRAISTLGIICKNEFRRNNDVNIFLITVHLMRNALENIGETELSSSALKLEQAGQAYNIALIKAETPAFLNALREVSKKVRPKKGLTDKDLAFLHEKLLVIQEACAAFDKTAIKNALVELKHKSWPLRTKEVINTLVDLVLQDKFAEAAAFAGDYCRPVMSQSKI